MSSDFQTAVSAVEIDETALAASRNLFGLHRNSLQPRVILFKPLLRLEHSVFVSSSGSHVATDVVVIFHCAVVCGVSAVFKELSIVVYSWVGRGDCPQIDMGNRELELECYLQFWNLDMFQLSSQSNCAISLHAHEAVC